MKQVGPNRPMMNVNVEKAKDVSLVSQIYFKEKKKKTQGNNGSTNSKFPSYNRPLSFVHMSFFFWFFLLLSGGKACRKRTAGKNSNQIHPLYLPSSVRFYLVLPKIDGRKKKPVPNLQCAACFYIISKYYLLFTNVLMIKTRLERMMVLHFTTSKF